MVNFYDVRKCKVTSENSVSKEARVNFERRLYGMEGIDQEESQGLSGKKVREKDEMGKGAKKEE